MSLFNMNFFYMPKYFFSIGTFLVVLLGLSLVETASAAEHQAQFANIDYDVVYVRCPRGKEPVLRPTGSGTQELLNWNGVNDLWLSATNNIYHQPGCDLVLHDSSMTPGDRAAEKVLVNCDEDNTANPVCSVVDPNVSFDGRYVVYTKFTDTRTFLTDLGINGLDTVGIQAFMKLDPNGRIDGNKFAGSLLTGFKPYANPALVFMYDLQTNTEIQVSPDSEMFAGRAHPGRDPEWSSKIPVMDTGPFFMPDGRIGFTSNREQGFALFQLFAMDRDGRNMEVLGHRAMANQLHPITLMDGRIIYTNFDRMLQRTSNNNFSLFEINPDGSAPFIFAGKNDPSKWSYHYITQLSDGDIVATLYYNRQQSGLGALERFPVNPPGPDFEHRTISVGVAGDVLATPPDFWRWGNDLLPFARPEQFRLTLQAGAGDSQMPPYKQPSDYFVHPVDGRTVTMLGRFTHPAAAPDNDLLTTYSIGGSSTLGDSIFRESLEVTQQIIGKDAGIWLLPLEANSTRQIGHIANDAQVVVDFPEYHEIMPRAVVSYQDIYGIARPDPDNTRPPTRNDGDQDQRLPAGAPYGLTGASSLYDRETLSLNGTPWNMRDGGGAMSGRNYMNLAVSGAELAIFDNDEIFGVRILMPVPYIPMNLYGGKEKWVGFQRHYLRILGEYPIRKPDENGVEPVDDQGNPDTSFIVRVPADTPFLMQTIDKRGMALDIETTSRSVTRGEQQFCAGCHVHTREGMDPFASRAKTNTNEFGDVTGDSAPLFVGVADGYPTVATAQETYAGEPGATARRSFGVDWDNNIASIIENRCASCHAEGQPAQQLTGLRLDGDVRTYDLIITNEYKREDGTSINAYSKPGNGLTDIDAGGTDRITPHFQCCTPSRWVSVNSARSSMLVWALYGERLDGRDPITGLPPADSGVLVDGRGLEHPEIWPKVSEHLSYVSDMPEAEKRLIARWLDIGAPKLNVHDDTMRPVMTLTPVGGTSVSTVHVGLWDDSPLDFARFKVTSDGVDITFPTIEGSPDIVTLSLSPAVTEANADSIEITLEIWDKPDRSWSREQPGVAAANRTRRTVTGRALLRMAGGATNRAPTTTSASIIAYKDTQSEGVYAQVTDPDVGDTHIVSIVSQPANGSATVINNQLVYTPDPEFVGDDSFQFSASDLGGLSVNGFASVTVLPAMSDTTSPTITLIGSNPQVIVVGTSYSELGATATDNVDGNVSGDITIDVSVNTAVIGSYSVAYNVADSAGNAATEVTRTVNVVGIIVDDNDAPVITLSGSDPQEITAGEPYVELGATAMDAVDGNLSNNIMIDASGVDTTRVGPYRVTYSVSDAAGNVAQKVRQVNVVTTSPPPVSPPVTDTDDSNGGGGGGGFGVWVLLALLLMKYGFAFIRRPVAMLADMEKRV